MIQDNSYLDKVMEMIESRVLVGLLFPIWHSMLGLRPASHFLIFSTSHIKVGVRLPLCYLKLPKPCYSTRIRLCGQFCG